MVTDWIKLPYPPSNNAMYERNWNGSQRLSDGYIAFKADVHSAVFMAHADKLPPETPIAAHIRLWRPRTNADHHNAFKTLFDALEGVLLHDDKWVFDGYWTGYEAESKPTKAENARCEVRLFALNNIDSVNAYIASVKADMLKRHAPLVNKKLAAQDWINDLRDTDEIDRIFTYKDKNNEN